MALPIAGGQAAARRGARCLHPRFGGKVPSHENAIIAERRAFRYANQLMAVFVGRQAGLEPERGMRYRQRGQKRPGAKLCYGKGTVRAFLDKERADYNRARLDRCGCWHIARVLVDLMFQCRASQIPDLHVAISSLNEEIPVAEYGRSRLAS